MKDEMGFEIVEAADPTVDEMGFPYVKESAPDVGELRRREGQAEIAANPPREVYSEPTPEPLSSPEGTAYETSGMSDPGGPEFLREQKNTAVGRLATAAGVMTTPFTGAVNGPVTIGRLAIAGGQSGAVQMATEEAVKQILGAAKPSASNFLVETGKGALAGAIATPVLGKIGSGLGRVAEAGSELLGTGVNRVKRAATTFWPSLRNELTPAQQRAAEARATIQSITGEEVPVGVAEAIGKPSLARKFSEVGQEGSEFTADEQDAIKRIVAMAATELRGSNPSSQELGQRAINLLQDELGRVSTPAKVAVRAVVNELYPGLSKASIEIQNQAQTLVPGTLASPTASGSAIRQTVQKGLHDLSDEAQAAYANAKLLADPNGVPVQIPSIKGQVAKIDFETPHTSPSGTSSTGRPVPTLVPAESRKFVSDIKDAGDEWTLQQALRVRSEIGRAIGDNELLPGIGRGDLKQLYKGLTADIEAALSPSSGSFPDTQALDAWRKAWSLTRKTSENFKYPLVENIVDEFGREGGTGPASIASKLTTAEAPSVIKALEVAAGPNNLPELNRSIREYLFNQVGSSARDIRTGDISVGDLLAGIRKLAPEVQARYFPGVNLVRDLANREAAVAGLRSSVYKGSPDSLISNLQSTDPALLAVALGPKPSADVTKRLQLALSEAAKEQALYNGTVLGRLKAGDANGLRDSVVSNPARFVRSIVDGTFSTANARKAIEILKTHEPDGAFRDLQFHFVDNLLNSNVSEAFGISTPKIAKELMGGTSGSSRSEVAEMAETVLGTERLNALRRVMGAYAELDKQGNMLTPASPVVDIGARVIGGTVGATAGSAVGLGTGGAAYQANFIARNYNSIKHWLASYLLTTQELRKLAMTPISQVSRTQMRDLMRGFSGFVLTQVPHGSVAEEEALDMAKQAER